MNQSKIEANILKYMALSAGKRVRASYDWFGFSSDWLRESGASFFNQSESIVKQNQSKHNMTFDPQLKTAVRTSIVV